MLNNKKNLNNKSLFCENRSAFVKINSFINTKDEENKFFPLFL